MQSEAFEFKVFFLITLQKLFFIPKLWESIVKDSRHWKYGMRDWRPEFQSGEETFFKKFNLAAN